MTKIVRLGPDEKWRIEVDMNYVHQLRIALNQSIDEFSKAIPIDLDTLNRMTRTGEASFMMVARLATYLQVQPGELIIWFPVPRGAPERIPNPYHYPRRKHETATSQTGPTQAQPALVDQAGG